MKPINVKFKKLNDLAVIPTYAHESDAGADLVAIFKDNDEKGNVVYGTGLAVEIPKGYVGLIFPRSSNSKKNLWLTNSVGVVDSNYRGEIMVKFRCSLSTVIYRTFWKRLKLLLKGKWCYSDDIREQYFHDDKFEYQIGERIAQLIIIPYPKVNYIEAEELSDTDRGTGGYGSTGK